MKIFIKRKNDYLKLIVHIFNLLCSCFSIDL